MKRKMYSEWLSLDLLYVSLSTFWVGFLFQMHPHTLFNPDISSLDSTSSLIWPLPFLFRPCPWLSNVTSFLFIYFLPSASGQPTLLPPDHVQELNLRSTGMLNNMQRLFSHHMVQTFGCDYSTSGITLEAIQNKLRSFLELRTADGPRHDTYLIFYSGHTQKVSGSWVLAGECHILIVLFYMLMLYLDYLIHSNWLSPFASAF